MPLLFATERHAYFYDDATRLVFPTEGYEKEYLEQIEHDHGTLDMEVLNREPRLQELSQKIKQYGLFVTPQPQTPVFTQEQMEERLRKEGIAHLCLTLTEACNFRCKYCVYSDHYGLNSGYSNEQMSLDTAKAAVDLYMSNNMESIQYNPNLSISIGFYGGEPLLNFSTIQGVVQYVEEKYKSYFSRMVFSVTTNGYLLDRKRLQFLLDHHFAISVSLDGDQEEHDRNRITVSGKPTFDIVFNNLLMLDEMYREQSAHNDEIYPYSLLITYDNISDLSRLNKFFAQHPNLDSRIARITRVKDLNSDYYNNSEQADNLVIQKQQASKDEFIGLVRAGRPLTNFIRKYVQGLIFEPSMNINYAHNPLGGLCVPGISKLTVDVNGQFHMCEKISPQYPIGDIHQGLNMEQQTQILNKGLSVIREKCQDCKVRSLCNICYVTLEQEGAEFGIPEGYCDYFQDWMKSAFSLYYSLLEENPELSIF
ncbi:radical SAM/SPASM domain-containing protein [Paenibacillus senegalimassiliensis]|uniref:radical SAM/SPASM domain-containing protein n=1 Tax=Paenibacillus senegalimassiliensis TaxID=1737426 RepID=UPI00073E93B3|nr:radical SAM protein [Paenibacillus senegalimassiliensis]